MNHYHVNTKIVDQIFNLECIQNIFQYLYIILEYIYLIFFCFPIYDRETVIAHEWINTYFRCSPFFDWLFISHPPPLTGEQYGKMEPK